MYGGFGFMRGGNDIFEKEDVTLEDVLDDDQSEFCLDVPSEKCKEFFTERQLKSLINYIIRVPEDDKDKKKAFKYPFMASKLLSSKSSIIIDFFFKKERQADKINEKGDSYDQFEADVLLVEEDTEETDNKPENSKNEDEDSYEINQANLDSLFKFLQIDDEINYVLAGYFSKTVASFIGGDTKSLILEYFYQDNSHYSEHLIDHIYCKSIATLLTQFLNFSKMNDDKNNSLNLDQIGFGTLRNTSESNNDGKEKEDEADEFSQKLLEKRITIFKTLINRLFASTDLEVLSNIRDVFFDFFKDSEEISMFKKVFEGVFFNADSINTLFKSIYLRGSRNKTKVAIISKIFARAMKHLYKIDADKDTVVFDINETLRNLIIENIPALIKVIQQTLETKTIQTSTFGKEGAVLGSKVIGIYDLILGFLSLGDEEVNNAIAENGLLDISMEIFCNYPWNNVYHCKFMKLLRFYLESDPESKLFNQVTSEAKLSKFLLKAYQRTTVEIKFKNISNKNLGYGFTGYLREIGNKILAIENEQKRALVTQNDEWEEFTGLYLTRINEFLSKERDDVFKIVEKKDSWMGGDFDDDDIMNELNNTIGGGIFNDANKDKEPESDDQEEDDFMSEESEPGSILNAIQKNHLQEQDEDETIEGGEFNSSKHFAKSVEPSNELIDSLLEEIEN